MGDLKQLTSSGGQFGGSSDDYDDMKLPENTKSLFFSSWMTKFGARTQRRGSLGFSDSHLGTPPARLDDDTNSGLMDGLYQSGESEKHSTCNTKMAPSKGSDSYCEVYGITPGEEGDSYFLINKYRRRS